jgi:hypothetical protein
VAVQQPRAPHRAVGHDQLVQLDGATDLFTWLEWTRPLRAEIPEPLRSQLIAHGTATGTESMRFRMRHGCGAGTIDWNGQQTRAWRQIPGVARTSRCVRPARR